MEIREHSPEERQESTDSKSPLTLTRRSFLTRAGIGLLLVRGWTTAEAEEGALPAEAKEEPAKPVAIEAGQSAPEKQVSVVRHWNDLRDGQKIELGDVTVITVGEGKEKRDIPTFFAKDGRTLYINRKMTEENDGGKAVLLKTYGIVLITVEGVHFRCEKDGQNRCLIIKGTSAGKPGESVVTEKDFARACETLMKGSKFPFTMKNLETNEDVTGIMVPMKPRPVTVAKDMP
jgi:hypothetical protein